MGRTHADEANHWRTEMKLIANLDFHAAKAGQELEFVSEDDCNYSSEELGLLAKDPVIDGLLRFRHPKAPWGEGASEVAKDLYEKWLYLMEEYDVGMSAEWPAERMIGTMFLVCCWKAFDRLQVGEVYEATIEDTFGLDTNGFVIYHDDQEIVVETMGEVINHFVLV